MSTSSLDILLLSDNNLDTVGGEQESTKIIINGLKVKYSLGIIQPGKIKKPISNVIYFNMTNQIRIKHLIKKPITFIKYVLKVKNYINRYNPKVIHTQSQVSFFMVALLKKIRLISKDNYLIHTERGLYTKYSKFFRRVFCYYMKELNTLVTTTEFNMKCWKRALKNKKLLLEYKIIENTAGELFEVLDETKRKSNREENIVIGFAGRYAKWKNWPLAIEISKKLNDIIEKKLQVKMAVGCLDEKALKETKIMYKDLDKIFGERFEGKININLEEMDNFYYDIDVFILTSNYNTESFGRTLVEAMSRETVVLTTDAGGSVEVVGNENNVLKTSDEFVEKILMFFNNRDKMMEEKERNLKRVRDVYSLDNNINKHLKMYGEILKVNSKTY